MRLILAATIVAALALSGCSKKEEAGYADAMVMSEIAPPPPPGYAPAASAMAPAAPAADAAGGSEPSPSAGPTSVPAMIAYVYNYALSAPQSGVRGLIARHEAACRAAGAATCQVVSSNVSEEGEYTLNARLELRASPAWTAKFRSGLAADVETSDGRIVSSGVTSEDLSRTIIDTGARLKAQTTLRDRLQALLASRPGKLADLIELERELARVQGEIDSAQSQLTYAQGRVNTSTLNLHYTSRDPLARAGVWQPLGSAFGDFIGLVVAVIAFLIRALAVILPIALLGWLLVWALRRPFGRMLDRRRADKAQKAEPPTPAAP